MSEDDKMKAYERSGMSNDWFASLSDSNKEWWMSTDRPWQSWVLVSPSNAMRQREKFWIAEGVNPLDVVDGWTEDTEKHKSNPKNTD